MYKVKYSNDAKYDIQDVSNYISQDSKQYWIKVILSIRKTIDLIKIFPYMWQSIDWEMRWFIEQKYKYKIIYRIEWEYIEILKIYKNKNIY